mmetsp:Transcript_17331/g.59258  ORF Transcript_17331/g.59258 Transcript_17331/m.59258 type:complete len:233 (-) Transcript_17331:106-804(-)
MSLASCTFCAHRWSAERHELYTQRRMARRALRVCSRQPSKLMMRLRCMKKLSARAALARASLLRGMYAFHSSIAISRHLFTQRLTAAATRSRRSIRSFVVSYQVKSAALAVASFIRASDFSTLVRHSMSHCVCSAQCISAALTADVCHHWIACSSCCCMVCVSTVCSTQRSKHRATQPAAQCCMLRLVLRSRVAWSLHELKALPSSRLTKYITAFSSLSRASAASSDASFHV